MCPKAPVAQLDRAPASEAGSVSSSCKHFSLFKRLIRPFCTQILGSASPLQNPRQFLWVVYRGGSRNRWPICIWGRLGTYGSGRACVRETDDIRRARGYIEMWLCRSGKIIRLFYIRICTFAQKVSFDESISTYFQISVAVDRSTVDRVDCSRMRDVGRHLAGDIWS